MNNRLAILIGMLAVLPGLAHARDSLGVYAGWAAFRDAETPRCYAIAANSAKGASSGYASVGTWPARNVRGQLHIRLSRAVSQKASVVLTIGSKRFDLVAGAQDAWAKDKAMDAAVLAAMRSASRMSVSARARNGTRFTDSYRLEGAATAMDAAVVGCASR